MDSQDSSSSTATNRDGSATDNDGVVSVIAALAKDAALYFQSHKFAGCIKVLNQLKQKKEDDLDVISHSPAQVLYHVIRRWNTYAGSELWEYAS